MRLLWPREDQLNSTGLTSDLDHRISVFIACRKTKPAADELWTQQPGLLDLRQTCSLPRCLATSTASMKLLSQISNVLYGFMLMISTSTDLVLRIYATNRKWDWKGEPDSTINNSFGEKRGFGRLTWECMAKYTAKTGVFRFLHWFLYQISYLK